MIHFSRVLTLLLGLTLGQGALADTVLADTGAPPKVVTTIPPVHALVARIMDGVGVPDLLLSANQSPHAYALKPSDARRLQEADLIFWVGPALETFLQATLGQGQQASVLALMDTPDLVLLEQSSDGGDDHHGGTVDPHIWLDPENAKAMAKHIGQQLSARDPARAALYQANATAFATELDALTRDLHAQLTPVHTKPYVALHDAYQYFEKRFGMTSLATVTVSPERPVGAGHARHLRSLFAEGRVHCAFVEPQAPSKLIVNLTGGTEVGVATLDALGAGLPPGPELYETLMRNLGTSFATCLARS